MASLDVEGRPVPLEAGDTVASALFRAGVRTFGRSLKHHARRGLYCLTGDCPNCLCTVDGEPGARACTTEARDGMRVRRETGRPSVETDVLSVTRFAGRLMPVGFYSKTFIRPRFAWEVAEKVIRRATGLGTLSTVPPRRVEVRTVHVDVLVVGAGVAGLAAALEATERGEDVLVADELRPGELLAPGATRDRLRTLEAKARRNDRVTVLERHGAVGIYEGPMVPLAGPDELLRVHPGRVVVATGAVETHGVFAGNDLPGVWLGRGAARMAGAHGIRPGERAVVVAHTEEAFAHVATLGRSGVEIAAIVAPAELADRAPGGARVFRDGRTVAAEGSKGVRAVVIAAGSVRERVGCDTLVLSLGLTPRDALLRMAGEEPVSGAGDVVWPGCSLGEAEESGRTAARGEPVERRPLGGVVVGGRGTVCLCEDVSIGDLREAWAEGWRSSEILKRYTTATMGPCQGVMCGRLVASFAAANAGAPRAGARTTARPPARPVPLEILAAGVHETGTKRTSLHDRHLEMGAHLDRSGSWVRPYRYGDWREDHRAVRERVSVMDVGTLGKFLVAGRDARALVDRVFPCDVEHLEPGRSRYLIALDEAGYAMDDGLLCANPDGTYTITSTSGASDRMEAGLRNWIDRWGLHVHLVNQTAMLGAINVAGPLARELLERLTDDPVDGDAIAYPGHGRITVAGVPCNAIRSGFVGELSFELHHPRSRGVELWDALLAGGRDLGIRPHGLDALDVLRLEKGHPFLAQDTLPDDHPTKLGLDWAVDLRKPAFVGKIALERMAAFPLERKLVGFRFDSRPQRGAPVYASARVVGRVTSCAVSPALGYPIGLGWLRTVDGAFPERVQAGSVTATVVPRPFLDPEGARIRA